MIGEILNAVLKETTALLDGTGASVLLKTNFKLKDGLTNSMPLVLLDLQDGPDTTQYPGGLTRCDWVFSFNSYNYEPDAYVDDTSSEYSAKLLNFIDIIREHFSTGLWLTTDMGLVFDLYGFQYTLSGITVAEAIDQDGLIMGYKIGFESTAFDNKTLFVVPSINPLEEVKQVSNPPFGPVIS